MENSVSTIPMVGGTNKALREWQTSKGKRSGVARTRLDLGDPDGSIYDLA